MSLPNPRYRPPADTELVVFHRDRSILAVDKPAGLLAVPGRGADKQDCLLTRVQKRFADARAVHRLDMDTSGIMLFALGAENERELSLLFQKRLVLKKYIAIADGCIRDDAGEISLPLVCDWPNRPLQIVDHENGKPSLTRFRVLERNAKKNTTRVELIPLTGRTHQLRVHLLSIGHPILGDRLYANETAYASAPRMLLHATELEFPHPADGCTLRIESRLPF